MQVILRPWNQSDVSSLVQYINNWNISQFMRDQFQYPMTPDQALAFISSQNTTPPLTQFAIDLNGEAIGHIEIVLQSDVYRKSAELGCWLAEPYWGKGLAKQAVVLMLTHAFIKFDLNRIYARIFANNRQSQRLVESVGFILEGKLSDAVYKSGEFQDELIYSIRRLR